MQMLRTFSREAFEFGLASWRWLGISGKTPRFTTLFGDVFLESLEGWWFLDTVEGTLELRWTTAVDMYAELETPEGRATYLLDDLVREATRRGLRLAPDEVYAFQPHPAAGGEMSIEYVTMVRFALAVGWSGQVHEQLRWPGATPAAEIGWSVSADHLTGAWDTAWQGSGSVPAEPAKQVVGRHAQPADPQAGAAAAAGPATGSWQVEPGSPAGQAAEPFATGTYPAVPTATQATVPYQGGADTADGYGAATGYGAANGYSSANGNGVAAGYGAPDGYGAAAPADRYPATGTFQAPAYGTGIQRAVPATVPAPTGGEPYAAPVETPAASAVPAWEDLWRRR